MVVLLLRKAKPGFRGELSRWLLEAAPGVFVGNVPARVRDQLWEKVAESGKAAAALMIFTASTEQGFEIRHAGDSRRIPVDFDGITLIRYIHRQAPKASEADM